MLVVVVAAAMDTAVVRSPMAMVDIAVEDMGAGTMAEAVTDMDADIGAVLIGVTLGMAVLVPIVMALDSGSALELDKRRG